MPRSSEALKVGPALPEPSLYERDVYGWAVQQAQLIRAGRFAEIDIENVAEEIESVGKSERSSLRSALARIFQHMLKWDHQPERRTRSWVNSIKVHRTHAARSIRDNPGLKPEMDEIMDDAYRLAILYSAEETGLLEEEFPRSRPYDLRDALERSFTFSENGGRD